MRNVLMAISALTLFVPTAAALALTASATASQMIHGQIRPAELTREQAAQDIAKRYAQALVIDHVNVTVQTLPSRSIRPSKS
jgi:hypothetical protein